MAISGRKAQNIAHYNNKIVAQLLLKEPYSCIEMSKQVKLTHTATGLIVDRLLNMELIRVHTENISKRSKGRQHVRYEIAADRAFFVCINLQYEHEFLTIYDLVGKVLHKERLFVQKVDNSFLLSLVEKIKLLLKTLELSEDRLSVISVAVPGRVDKQSGTVISSSRVNNDVNIIDLLQNNFSKAKIDLNNDIVYACTGSMLTNEFDYNSGSHFFLYISSGLSCALIHNGSIVLGENGFGGEIGMNYVDRNCTRLHDVATVESILSFGRNILKNEEATLQELVTQSESIDELKDKFLSIAEILGTTVRNIVDITGASHIVFSGVVTCYPKFFFERFSAILKETNYSHKISYKFDFSKYDTAEEGQIQLSRLDALDWVMAQY